MTLVSDGIAALGVHTLVCQWTRGPVCRLVSVVSAGGDGPPVNFAPWSNVDAVRCLLWMRPSPPREDLP